MVNVSVIVPCYNEEATICQLLEAIRTQSYPIEEIEVIIADGLSTDDTRKNITRFQTDHPEMNIRVVDNRRRVIPSGLNRAIEAANGRYLLRMDAHSIPYRDYIRKCVDGLEQGLGDNVGGIWKIFPGDSTWIAKAIAIAVAHPLGAGDARYRIGGSAQEVDTVPFGAFRRETIDHIGKYDENLLSNEDYELNARLKKSGGKVWLDPSIQTTYFSRSNLRDLSKQYWRYGYWKVQMLRKHPTTWRLRQIIPPLFVLSILILGCLSIFNDLARLLLILIVIPYTVAIFIIGFQMSLRHNNPSFIIGVPIATATIHISWGLAFLWGLVALPILKDFNNERN